MYFLMSSYSLRISLDICRAVEARRSCEPDQQAAAVVPARAAEGPVYRTPPAAVADLLTAPRVPRGAPNLSPDGVWIAQADLRSLIPIATLAEPVEKLAGLEILPGLHATRNGLKNAAAGLTFYRVADGVKVRAKLPADARLGAVVWSNAGDRVACALFAEGGAQLWIVEAATGTAMHIEKVALQGVPSLWMEWTLDDKALLCALVDDSKPAPTSSGRVPRGPAVRASSGRAAPQRTSRDGSAPETREGPVLDGPTPHLTVVRRVCDYLLAAAFLAGAFLAAAFLAGAFLAGAFFAAAFLPATAALNSAPARNFGTEVALIFTVAPVCGLRPTRAARSAFSNAPKPLMATLSPLATDLTISSTSASTASPASFLVTSRRAARRSTSSALLTLSATMIPPGTRRTHRPASGVNLVIARAGSKPTHEVTSP